MLEFMTPLPDDAVMSGGTGGSQPPEFLTTGGVGETKYYLGDIYTYSFGVLDFWFGMQAMTMNTFVMSFYCKQFKKIVPFMYLIIAVCDFFTGTTAILNSLTFFLVETDTYSALHLIQPAYVMSSITFKVSVFLNLMIAILRTINIYRPFYQINLLVVGNIILFYTLGWIGFIIWQLIDSHLQIDKSLIYYIYQPGNYHAVYTGNTDERAQFRNMVLFIGIPFFLPSVLTIICMAAQIKAILKQQPDKTSNTLRSRQITKTILMLTILFFVCNTVYLTYVIYDNTGPHKSHESNEDMLYWSRREYMMSYLTGVVAPFVNAAFNPVILIVRGEAMRVYLKKKIRRVRRSTTSTILSLKTQKSNNYQSEQHVLSGKSPIKTL